MVSVKNIENYEIDIVLSGKKLCLLTIRMKY